MTIGKTNTAFELNASHTLLWFLRQEDSGLDQKEIETRAKELRILGELGSGIKFRHGICTLDSMYTKAV